MIYRVLYISICICIFGSQTKDFQHNTVIANAVSIACASPANNASRAPDAKKKNAQPNIRLRRGKRATQIVASAERAPRSRAGAGPAELVGKCCHTRVLRLSDGDDLPGKTERKCAISVCKQQSSNPLQQWQPSDCPAAVRENATKKSGTKSDVRLQPWWAHVPGLGRHIPNPPRNAPDAKRVGTMNLSPKRRPSPAGHPHQQVQKVSIRVPIARRRFSRQCKMARSSLETTVESSSVWKTARWSGHISTHAPTAAPQLCLQKRRAESKSSTRCRTASRAKQRNGRRPAKTCQDTRHDAPPVAKTQRHAAHKKCLTSLSEALKEEVTAPHHPWKERNVAVWSP